MRRSAEHQVREKERQQPELRDGDQRIGDERVAVVVERVAAGEQDEIPRDVHDEEGEQQEPGRSHEHLLRDARHGSG